MNRSTSRIPAVSYTHLRAVGRLVFGGQDELTAKEAVRMVIQRSQRTVAETEESGVDVPLVALDTLALQVQLGFGSHDGLDIIRLGQGVHVHVVVDHQQAAFQIGTCLLYTSRCV